MKMIYIVILVIFILAVFVTYRIINSTFEKLNSGDMKVKGQDEFEDNLKSDIEITRKKLEEEKRDNNER